MLHSAGLEDWIADDDDDYVEKAVAFANEPLRLAMLRDGLRDALIASPLVDASRFARHLEAALEGMWRERVADIEKHSGSMR